MAVTRGLFPAYLVNSSSEFATTWEQGAVMYALSESQQRILNGTELFPSGYGNAIGQISAGTTNQSSGTIVFSNSNGVTFGMNAGTITASIAAAPAAGIAAISGGTTQMTSGTAIFSNSNGVSFGADGNTLTASVAAIKSISAGTTRGTNGEIVFSNSNGVSFGIDGNTITASVLGGAAGSISAGTTRATLGEVIFSNSNGISFAMNAGTVTASYTVPTQSAQTVGLYALGNTTQNSSTTLDARSLSFNAIGSLTVGYSNGSIQLSAPNALTTAMVSDAGSRFVNTSAGLNLTNISATFNSNSISLSVAAQTNQTVGLYAVSNTTQNSSTTLDARSLSFQGAGVASVGYSNGSVVISVSAQTAAAAPVNISAGTTSNNLATIVYSNSNGVSFGLNGSTITGSIATSLTNINYSAGTTSNNLSNIVYRNSNGVSFGLNGSTITASVPLNATLTQRVQFPHGNLTVVAAMGNGSFSINRIDIDQDISATRIDVPFLLSLASSAAANTWGLAVTAFACIYTKNVSTLSSLSSGQVQWNTTLASNTAGNTGLIAHAIRPMSVGFNIIATPGEYYVGFGISTNTSSVGTATTALGNTWSVMGGMIYSSAVGQVGDFTAATNTSTGLLGGQGIYSAAISTVPPTVSLSAINQTGSYYARGNMGIIFRNI